MSAEVRPMTADDLEPTRNRYRRQRPVDHVLVQGRAEERLDRGQGGGRIVTLVGAVRTSMPRPNAASATISTGRARGESGAQATSERTPAVWRASSMATGSRPRSMPTTATASPSTVNSSINVRANMVIPATLF